MVYTTIIFTLWYTVQYYTACTGILQINDVKMLIKCTTYMHFITGFLSVFDQHANHIIVNSSMMQQQCMCIAKLCWKKSSELIITYTIGPILCYHIYHFCKSLCFYLLHQFQFTNFLQAICVVLVCRVLHCHCVLGVMDSMKVLLIWCSKFFRRIALVS